MASTGLVLGGGGARGAYEAGVLAGLAEILGPRCRRGPFDVVCGTSVGAINAAWVAAHADQSDLGVDGLLDHWRGLRLEEHLRLDVRSWLGVRRRLQLGKAILDPGELERLVIDGLPWERLRRNIDEGVMRALIVTALHVGTGRTTVFTDLAPGERYPASRDPRRRHLPGPVGPDHVLASAAVPLLFPARRVGDAFYADGGLRFNTPIAPALRMQIDKLVVIPLLKEEIAAPPREIEAPTLVFLAGKLLDALLLDPIAYDLAVLERFNRLVEVLEDTLDDAELARVNEALERSRGAPYRRVQTLVFRPTLDIGALAREHGERMKARGWRGRAAARLADLGGAVDADLLSFILFDGDYAGRLIELGRRDVRAREDEVRAFFGV